MTWTRRNGLKVLCAVLVLVLAYSLVVSAGSKPMSYYEQKTAGNVYTQQLAHNVINSDVDWDGPKAQFFDWLLDLFGWVDDAAEDISGAINEDYDDTGIPNSPFAPNKYGMNVHKTDQLSVQQYENTLKYAGEWIRLNMHTDAVADENFGALKTGMERIHQAGDNLGINPKVVINLNGYSNNHSGGQFLLRDLSWDEKGMRYENLANTLASAVLSWGYNETIFESWNEPDHENSNLGIGITPEHGDFVSAMIKLNDGFSGGVRRAGGITAFSPFVTFNEDKFDVMKTVWEHTHTGYNYFSAHMYDDEPGKARHWAGEVSNFTADRPVIITEHGYQEHRKDFGYYRRQAWAFEQGFQHNGQSTLAGVMGYVYGSDDKTWEIQDHEDFFWLVTHDGKPG